MPPVLTSLDAIVDPRRSALLVVDLQHDFIHPRGWSARHGGAVDGLRAVIPAVNRLIAAARSAEVPIVYVLMEHGLALDAPNYRARYESRGMAADILCAAGTWGAELDGEVTGPHPDELRVVRHSYDGFAGTDLDARLRARGVETVVATGVVTNLCVQTTVQHAFALGYYVAVAEDGVAAVDETIQRVTLDNFRQYFGAVVPGEVIASHWTRRQGG